MEKKSQIIVLPIFLLHHSNLRIMPTFHQYFSYPLLAVSITISLPYVNTTLATHNATWQLMIGLKNYLCPSILNFFE